MKTGPLQQPSLARTFAASAAVMTAMALLVTAIMSFWIVNRERESANLVIARNQANFNADRVGQLLKILSDRVEEIAINPIMANGLIDSTGREAYLVPYLQAQQNINGAPVGILFTDFEGNEIARNGNHPFSEVELMWLRRKLEAGEDGVAIMEAPDGAVLLGAEMLRYARTHTPEGALLYKIRLSDVERSTGAQIHWVGDGQHHAAEGHPEQVIAPIPVSLPRRFNAIKLDVHVKQDYLRQEPAWFDILVFVSVAALICIGVFGVAFRLAQRLTRDLRDLEGFARTVSLEAVGARRALPGRSAEVSSLAESTNRMLDRLREQHAELQSEKEKFFQMANTISQLAWMTDAEGKVLWMNDRWHAYTGTVPSDPNTLERWHLHLDPEGAKDLLDRWQETMRLGRVDRHTARLRGADGVYRSFYTNIAPFRNSEGRITHWFGTQTDVSELERAKQEAEAAARTKSQFLANMSHEIRTPMNTVIGMAELALRLDPKGKLRDYLGKIQESGQHLLAIIDDILDFSKIEAGRLDLEEIPFDLRTAVAEVAALFRDKALEKGLRFAVDVADDVPAVVTGDALRLKQVLINLVGNAIKFTPRGHVLLRVRMADETSAGKVMVHFEVEDSGIGMDEIQAGKLFNPFQQGDSSTTRNYGGSGLGLAISKRLAEQMGGSVGVSSVLDQGSRFWFTVALGTLAGGEHARLAFPRGARPPLAVNARPLQDLVILVAEDNVFNQEVARDFLESAGARVTIAGNGMEAIDLLDAGAYDCVLMDVQMPLMDGIEAAQRIRRMPQWQSLPIIAMTANVSKEDVETCLRAGMTDFVSKPFVADNLFALIASHAGMPSVSMGTEPARRSLPSPIKPIPAGDALPAFDPDALRTLIGDDLDKIRHFANRFLTTSRNATEELHAALVDGDFAAMASLGHRQKSSARAVGANALADLYLALEVLRDNGSPEQARALIADIDAHHETLESSFQRWFDRAES
ncbi:PAS domain-containing hybrid sensor histidine kinase/response regulator [Noviherbaspirillum galbum]|uniref:Sensory/regulatory protein RpfC n=1 Tax=Noviherbaspirillum galbum TaxID=2709383 RepID=A0A6B3SLV3_9BURK|nr:PAS domain-containing hybrid sensor histidine kinase/response regulator [Noviherbaspirillum galbum]NEX59626.1 response regulator [Noviherbaspirillum galbum]